MPGVGKALQCHRFDIPTFFWALSRTRIDASSPADVWQNILIATQPDQMIGRKRDILSVRQSPLPTLLSLCVFLIKARR
jgi:hypothetical protein